MSDKAQDSSVRCIDGIPIRNIWFLLFYASGLFKHLGKERTALEASPDNYLNLVAEVFLLKVERRIKTGLSSQYLEQTDVISRVRGRVDFLETERKRLMMHGKVKCQYNDLRVDTPRNRYIRKTLEVLSDSVDDYTLINRAKNAARLFKQWGITGAAPTKKELSKEHMGRMNRDDKGMLDAAHLIHEIQLLSEEVGRQILLKPEQSTPYIKNLFTQAIKGFYAYSLMSAGWIVDERINSAWTVESLEESTIPTLEDISCDLALHHAGREESYLIDAKFTSLLTDEGTVSKADLYPLYTLLTTQKSKYALRKKARGLIIRPVVSTEFKERLLIEGCEIRLCTVDLRASARDIRRQLLAQVTFQ